MRRVFLVVLLAGAIYYTYVAFNDLNFLTRTGRPGPGFFPRLIGVSAILITLWTLVEELRKSEDQRERTNPQAWKDVVVLMALAVSYAVLLRLFGGFIATVIFLGVTLMILNRSQPMKNLALAILIPGGVYLLFDRVLNANLPPALFELPI
ncbi:MAG: tripartite tricarboxylate transporter TctB family protein [Pseudomonadota bacterium]